MGRDVNLAIAAVERRLSEIAREARLLRGISKLLRKYDDVDVGAPPAIGEVLGPVCGRRDPGRGEAMIPVEVEIFANDSIAAAARRLVAFAVALGAPTTATFNRIRLYAEPGMTVDEVCRAYDDAWERRAQARRDPSMGRAAGSAAESEGGGNP